MIRSLRLRLFFTVWPLIVVMIVVVAALSTRSTKTELAHFEELSIKRSRIATNISIQDSVAFNWNLLRDTSANAMLVRLSRQMADSSSLLVTNTDGKFVASSTPAIRSVDVQSQADGTVEIARLITTRLTREFQKIILSGTPIVNANGSTLGQLYIVPAPISAPSGVRSMVAKSQRSLWIAVSVTSVLAAIATYLLAIPVLSRVQRLTQAARQVRASSNGIRVAVRAHDELGELEQSFNEMATSLEQTEQVKREMISGVAHELRTPLTNVIGLVEAMRDGLRAPDGANLDSVLEEAMLLKRLIEELQELSLADAGALSLDFEPTNLVDEARHAVETSSATASNVHLEINALSHALLISADRRRLAQVLRNLLQNAIKHTPLSGTITLSVSQNEREAIVRVTDTGRGIPAEHLPLIWERFHRVDPSRDRATGGMGLGLALARRLVEAMHGTIDAESELNVGSTFIVRFPVLDSHEMSSAHRMDVA